MCGSIVNDYKARGGSICEMERSHQFSPNKRQGWGKLVWGLWRLNFFVRSPSLPSWLLQTQEGKRSHRKWAVVVPCKARVSQSDHLLRIWLFILSLLFLECWLWQWLASLSELGKYPVLRKVLVEIGLLMFIQVCILVFEACHRKVLQVEWRNTSPGFFWDLCPWLAGDRLLPVSLCHLLCLFKFPPLIRTTLYWINTYPDDLVLT